MKLTKNQVKALETIAGNRFGMTGDFMPATLKQLFSMGLISREPKTIGCGFWYRITEAGRQALKGGGE
ncbi:MULTISPECIES: hypothetical protein [Brucella]|uniref:Uncharacterized protein n=7 Tax=Brucella TaxID=234 RepID=A0AAI8H6E9_BRUSS|nr:MULTISPECIES: hypothetical protein [Brucella]EPZ74990.1 hypothetical protein M798_16295 [Brucella melitensis ADMAS-G1]ERM85637.1 hypothetical protein P865_12920 [Brucella abortus 82]ERT85101.1 hypothetical protein P050_00263 [Brucella abortus 90-12178]ERT96880.1 hypothetical protein P038_03172 [Brucella abortus 99-9971-135]ERT99619.1 hypothetical protein P039_03265 [Brucella abortus 07-0994-2411]EXU82606.1 hypothetical protein AX23_12195 [Brucella melitensis 548]KEX97743.1 hypothetical pr